MILKRFYDENLAQFSYLIGCGLTREALVVDPNRDVDLYILAAEKEGLRVTHITETHIHADFVSGSRELAERTGARIHLSGEGGPEWQYAFVEESEAQVLRDRDSFWVGNVRIQAVHTPGHTPEHLTYLVTDGATADRPIGALTGDFIFAGDVGRPDLLERAAHYKGTMVEAARTLDRSLKRFLDQPDYLQIWPGHGAGSACGKGISSIPHTTVGYERLFNWGLRLEDEEEFVRQVLSGQPEAPRYFAEMKRINREGPPILGGFRVPPRLPARRLIELVEAQALVIDTRPAHKAADGYVSGTLNIPLDRTFNTWAGWLVPYDRDIHLLVDDRGHDEKILEAVRDLALIGLDRIGGYFGLDAVEGWERSGRPLSRISSITAQDLSRQLAEGTVQVLDVRGESEWLSGHIPGARHLPLGYLPEHVSELAPDREWVVHCQSGGRGAIAASLLRRCGLRNVSNLEGGFQQWRKQDLAVKAPS